MIAELRVAHATPGFRDQLLAEIRSRSLHPHDVALLETPRHLKLHLPPCSHGENHQQNPHSVDEPLSHRKSHQFAGGVEIQLLHNPAAMCIDSIDAQG